MGDTGSHTERTRFPLNRGMRAAAFLCVSAMVYGLLTALWPVWGAVYSRLYLAAANSLLGSFGSRAVVRFTPSEDISDEVKITFFDRQRLDSSGRPIPLMRVAHDVRHGVYIYVVFLAALIVATPVPRRRRAWAMLWGLVAIHAFMAMRLTLLIAYLLSEEQMGLLVWNRFGMNLLLLATQVFTINVLPGFVVAIILWAFLCFRRGDWSRLVGSRRRFAYTPDRTAHTGS